jgi:hypothetical protein
VLYISPINESVCRNGLVKQVLEWSKAISETKAVLANQMNADTKELGTNWLPDENQKANLSKGWRKNIRYVFSYNGNGDITHYMKFELKAEDVHLHWIVGRPEEAGARINCGDGVVPLRAMMAFIAKVGQLKGLPVVLLADTGDLVEKYQQSGFELTGRSESSKPEMILKVANLGRPSQPQYKGQTEGTHWTFGGFGSLADYLGDGSK